MGPRPCARSRCDPHAAPDQGTTHGDPASSARRRTATANASAPAASRTFSRALRPAARPRSSPSPRGRPVRRPSSVCSLRWRCSRGRPEQPRALERIAPRPVAVLGGVALVPDRVHQRVDRPVHRVVLLGARSRPAPAPRRAAARGGSRPARARRRTSGRPAPRSRRHALASSSGIPSAVPSERCGLRRSSARISASGSTATTSAPVSTSSRVSFPVPAARSTTVRPGRAAALGEVPERLRRYPGRPRS